MQARLSATIELITVFGVSIATTALLFAGLAGVVAPRTEGASVVSAREVVQLPAIQVVGTCVAPTAQAPAAASRQPG